MSEAEAIVTIGRRVHDLLEQQGRSQAWLAEKALIERSTVARIVRGDRNPTPETLRTIAAVLGVTVAQLVVGTDAAERVKDADDLVSRRHFEAAVGQVLEYEAKANDLGVRLRQMEELLQRERVKVREAREDADRTHREFARIEKERDDARQEAERCKHDARRYREALERAVADVARMQEQLRELGAAVEESKRNGKVAAILAGGAFIVTVAQYLGTDPRNAHDDDVDDPD